MARKKRELAGKRFGRWLVVRFSHSRPYGGKWWHCLCDCGTPKLVSMNSLIEGSKSCGCLQRDVAKARAADLTGRRFGLWTVLRFHRLVPKGGGGGWWRYWLCRCDCGREKPVFGPTLTSGRSKSCGCNRKATNQSHGASGSKEHRSWLSMKARCCNPKNPAFDRYGGAGVTIWASWLNSFQEFLTYVGPAPSPTHSLDRYPNPAGNYEPGNVRWATDGEQCRNRRNNVMVTHDGRTMCAHDWAKELGIKHTTLRRRLEVGWSVQRALTVPVSAQNAARLHLVAYRGKTLCIEDWAKRVGIKATTLHERLKRGWSVHKTLTTPVN